MYLRSSSEPNSMKLLFSIREKAEVHRVWQGATWELQGCHKALFDVDCLFISFYAKFRHTFLRNSKKNATFVVDFGAN